MNRKMSVKTAGLLPFLLGIALFIYGAFAKDIVAIIVGLLATMIGGLGYLRLRTDEERVP